MRYEVYGIWLRESYREHSHLFAIVQKRHDYPMNRFIVLQIAMWQQVRPIPYDVVAVWRVSLRAARGVLSGVLS